MGYYQSGDERSKQFPVSFSEWEAMAGEMLVAGPFGYVFGGAGSVKRWRPMFGDFSNIA
ncbi:hypothetical protein KZ483_15390 [Paenibacillus sp. sptzw28]|uniref:hypothetical protein n=1 Tax=Paenibacillus sp. sptzw28 TaxID=715179 RepID=UPI001C6F2512|nr:hypothetical protein [Paenibacillus sp. sptzw28]QYR19320.1 hypothetical protein KZ483_15390 [Paenibacillus sp. sptzw28]